MVFGESNKGNQTKMPPEYKATFTIKPFGGKYMTFVHCEYKTHSNSDRLLTFESNSLWRMGAEPLHKILKKIDKYKDVQQIINDFKI